MAKPAPPTSQGLATVSDENTAHTDYLRVVALGDSTTVGLGDRLPDGSWRGWSRLLVDAMGPSVSYLNTAVSGATVAHVRAQQLDDACAHSPQLASLLVGVNDTMRSTWHPGQVRDDLLHCAAALADSGATLLLARFPELGSMPLPAPLRAALNSRILVLNEIVTEVATRHRSILVDLDELYRRDDDVGTRALWSVDRLHPSQLGHRRLAAAFAGALQDNGFQLQPIDLTLDVPAPGRVAEVQWLVTAALPWLARRASDLGPWAARRVVTGHRARTAVENLELPSQAST